MTENLRAKLVSVLTGASVAIALSEDETQGYPFVTYEMTVTPVYDKDGPYKYVGQTYIRVVSNDFSEADTLAGSVMGAIDTGFGRGTVYASRLVSVDKDCANDIWTIELYYTLSQYGDEPVVPDANEEPAGPAEPGDPSEPNPNNEGPEEEILG